MDWIKALTELIKALAHFAWPVLVGLIVWWFRKEIRKEIAALIARIWKFKAFGVEVETKEEFNLALENTKAATRPEAIEQVKTVIESSAKVTASGSIKREVEGLKQLMELAAIEPRDAIKQSWLLLGKTVLRAANVSGDNVEPNSEEISASLKRLESNVQFSDGLIRSIKNLQEIARKVFYQSQWAFAPSPEAAEEFVVYSAAARYDLGEKVQ